MVFRRSLLAAIVLAVAALGTAKSPVKPQTGPRVNDGRCTTWVSNAYYTGRYNKYDNLLAPEAMFLDLHCGAEFRKSDPRFARGFVTLFGGSGIDTSDPLYKGVREFARVWTLRILKRGGTYPILTGAGPGVMEAGLLGAKDAGGQGIGYTTYYGTQDPRKAFFDSSAVTTGLVLTSIEMREILMINHTAAAVIAPGGTGTEWELFETLDGLKNGEITSKPVYLVGNRQRNWATFDSLLHDMVRRRTVSDTVFQLFRYVENPVDVADSLEHRLLK